MWHEIYLERKVFHFMCYKTNSTDLFTRPWMALLAPAGMSFPLRVQMFKRFHDQSEFFQGYVQVL